MITREAFQDYGRQEVISHIFSARDHGNVPLRGIAEAIPASPFPPGHGRRIGDFGIEILQVDLLVNGLTLCHDRAIERA